MEYLFLRLSLRSSEGETVLPFFFFLPLAIRGFPVLRENRFKGRSALNNFVRWRHFIESPRRTESWQLSLSFSSSSSLLYFVRSIVTLALVSRVSSLPVVKIRRGRRIWSNQYRRSCFFRKVWNCNISGVRRRTRTLAIVWSMSGQIVEETSLANRLAESLILSVTTESLVHFA